MKIAAVIKTNKKKIKNKSNYLESCMNYIKFNTY